MGTYGVTHVKKDDKIIPFSDSYDGYWSGMGQANLIGLKYISISKLGELFDSFTARKSLTLEEIKNFQENYDDNDDEEDEKSLSTREIQNFISQVSSETNHSSESLEWANSVAEGDIRASAIGVVPLLYMNLHPHYGVNYDYCDYLVDLDKNTFVFNNIGLELPLSLIQKTPIENIRYLFVSDLSFAKERIIQDFPEFQGNLESLIYNLEDSEKSNALVKLKKIIEFIFSLPNEPIKLFFEDQEKERLKYLEEYNKKRANIVSPLEDDTDSYSYSIYSAQVSANQLRKIIYFLQEKAKSPEFAFILNCVEWGLDENYINGGIRLMTPNNLEQEEKFKEIMSILEYSFKQNFNIMSGAGFGSGFLGEDLDLTIQKSIFSFEDLKSNLTEEDFNIVMNEGLPYLAYHTYIEEASAHIISKQGYTNSPIFWTFVSLLSQNKALFDSVYENARNQLSTLQEADSKRVLNLYMSSFYDGEQIVKLLNQNSKFVIDLMTTSFFEDCEPVLTEIEAKEYLC